MEKKPPRHEATMNSQRAPYMPTGDSIEVINLNSRLYPSVLTQRLGENAPDRLWAIGRPDLIHLPKTALFCSKNCPGDAILAAMDQAQNWRDESRAVISGFHSPVEKECLNILLRGWQPVILCPARSIERMRIPKDWRPDIRSGRLLILSGTSPPQHRMTKALADARNLLVAALAEDAFVAYIAPGGKTANITDHLARWKIPFRVP